MRKAAQGLLLITYLLYAGFADGVPEGGMVTYVAVGLAILIGLAVTCVPDIKEPRRGRSTSGASRKGLAMDTNKSYHKMLWMSR